MAGNPAGPSPLEFQLQGQLVGPGGQFGRPRTADQPVADGVHLPEDDVARARQLGQGQRDLLEERLELELLRQRRVDVRERAQPPAARIESRLRLPPRLERAVELLGELFELVSRRDVDRRALPRFEVPRAPHERAHRAVHAVADEPGDEKRQHRRRPETKQIALEPGQCWRIGDGPRHRGHHDPVRPGHAGPADQVGHAADRAPLGGAAAPAEERARFGHAAQMALEEIARSGGTGQHGAPRRHDGDGLPEAERQRAEVVGERLEIDLGAEDAYDITLAIVDGNQERHDLAMVHGARPRRHDLRLATPQKGFQLVLGDERPFRHPGRAGGKRASIGSNGHEAAHERVLRAHTDGEDVQVRILDSVEGPGAGERGEIFDLAGEDLVELNGHEAGHLELALVREAAAL